MKKNIIKKLLALEIKENGISEKTFNSLNEKEKEMLIKKNRKYFLKIELRKKIKIGLIGGVFDVLHIGHVVTLNEAKKHCDFLVVVIARDEHIKKKGREPIHTQIYRAKIVEFLKPVDAVILGKKNYKKVLEIVKPDIIIYGYDQEPFLKPPGVKIIKLNVFVNPNKFKSSKIVKRLGI